MTGRASNMRRSAAIARRRAPAIGIASAILAAAAAVAATAPSARAEIGAIMNVGAAFVAANDIDRIAGDLNFGSLSPGVDGGVLLQFGRIDHGWSGAIGLDAFWSRRRLDDIYFPDDSGPLESNRSAFTVTAIGFPASAIYSLPRMGGRVWAGAGAGYYVATVRANTNISGSNYFPNDGTSDEGERAADGFGAHAMAGYERATRVGRIGGGVLARLARFPSDEVRGSSDFDVDLSGVTVFLSLSVRQAKK